VLAAKASVCNLAIAQLPPQHILGNGWFEPHFPRG